MGQQLDEAATGIAGRAGDEYVCHSSKVKIDQVSENHSAAFVCNQQKMI